MMDKSWTKITNKIDPKFMNGAIAFAEMAKIYVDSEGRTHCPCNNCLNVRKHAPDVVCSHIIHHGFQQSYDKELYALSRGPGNRVISHGGYIVNGVKFIVKSRNDRRRTQNCGVTALGIHNGVEEDYYGYVDDVLEFSFIKGYRVILFKCIWFDTDRKRKHVMFEPQFISVDTTKQAYKEDPFVLANQANQVFYVNDPIRDSGWKIIERSTHRHLWDIPDNEDAEDLFEHIGTSAHTITFQASDCENFEFHRVDGEEEFVEIDDVEAFEDDLDDFINDDTHEIIVEELPEELDDSNETNVTLYDESDDEYDE